jgi:hypothetical protein
MPSLTISNVNTGSNQLTITGHGLVTGDGPAAVRDVTGQGLPAPLVALTDYWVIRADANLIRLATSLANALAGTAIDITTAPVGTRKLEIGIPYRRARTYAALAQVKSVDLNAVQDSLTAQNDRDRGVKVRHIPAVAGLQIAGTAMNWVTGEDWIVTTATNNVFRIPIILNQGERLLQVDAKVQTIAAGDTVSMVVKRTDSTSGSGSSTQLGATSTSDSPPTVKTLSTGIISLEDVGTGFIQYYAEFTVGAFGSGTRIAGLLVTTLLDP